VATREWRENMNWLLLFFLVLIPMKCTAALQEYLNEYVMQTVRVVPLAIRREPKDLYTVGCRSVLFGSALI
jgi:hypothetical protein